MPEPRKVNVAIVGAGPAGIAAAIFLQRAGWEPLLLERDRAGGLLRNARLVENYPGFPGGIPGKMLVEKFLSQANGLGVRVTPGDVRNVSSTKKGFRLRTEKHTFLAAAVIIATGTVPKHVSIPGLRHAADRVFYEPADIIPEKIKGSRIAVIGGGDAAFDYALGIKEQGAYPIIVSRGEPCCLPLLSEKARDGGIEILTGHTPSQLKQAVKSMALECMTRKGKKSIAIDYILVACGREPCLPRFDKILSGRVLKVKRGVGTTVPGMFFAGDVIRGRLRQASTAVGDGVHAAMLADDFLKNLRKKERRRLS